MLPSEQHSFRREPHGEEPRGQERWIEYLTGVRTAKPSYYSAFRRREADLSRTIASLRDISVALCATTGGAEAVAQAVLAAAANHFGSDEAMMCLFGERAQWVGSTWLAWRWGTVSKEVQAGVPATAVAQRAMASGSVVFWEAGSATSKDIDPLSSDAACYLGVPMGSSRPAEGAMVVAVADGSADGTDIAVMGVLANQALVALDNARLFQQAQRERNAAEAGREAAREMSRRLRRRNLELSRARAELSKAEEERILAEERHRLAAELHDSVAQHLAGISLAVQWCMRTLPEDSPVHDRLWEANEMAKTALSRARGTIFELSCLSQGAEGLEEELAEVATVLAHHLEVSLHLEPGLARRLSAGQAHGLFHVAQEGLFNAAFHSAGSHATMSLRAIRRVVELRVQDDGCGKAEELNALLWPDSGLPRHRGLGSIRNWSARLGGEVRYEAGAEGGVALALKFPLRTENTTPTRKAGSGEDE